MQPMKITGPRSSTSTASARRSGAQRASGFAPVTTPEDAHTPSAPSNVSQASGVASVDALLALQSEEAAPDAPARAAARATDILDELDGLKMALLEGGAIAARVSKLAAAARRVRDHTGDARLEALLDEVETRAAVELAKHAAV